MKISFIIVTFDRDFELNRCVESIAVAAAHSPHIACEIVVIVQDQRRILDIAGLNVPIVRVCRCDSRNLSAARNAGIRESSGDYLVFIDDDAMVAKDFLVVAGEFIASGRGKAFCGRIIDPDSGRVFAKHFSEIRMRRLGRRHFRTFMGSAHVIHRDFFARYGGYDEDFGLGARFFGAEESDLFFRLLAHREPVWYVPGLVFYHRAVPVSVTDKIYKYASAIGSVLAKQIRADGKHAYAYACIIAAILAWNMVRIAHFWFVRTELGRMRFQYHLLVLRGTWSGFFEYGNRTAAGVL